MGPRGTIKSEHQTSRTKLVMLSGLSVVALAVGIRLVSSGPQSAPAASVSAKAPAASVATNLPQPAQSAVSVSWPAEVARDPFHSALVLPPPAPLPPAPVIAAPVAPPAPPPVDFAAMAREKIRLKAIVQGERPLAMMNGRLCRVGDNVEGFKIVEIGTNRITVERETTRLIVNVQ